jgi:hypothetical protein
MVSRVAGLALASAASVLGGCTQDENIGFDASSAGKGGGTTSGSGGSGGTTSDGPAGPGGAPGTGGATGGTGGSAAGVPGTGGLGTGGTGGADPNQCGDVVCGPGEFCCNESCSICAPDGGACIQIQCGPGGEACGNTTCKAGEYCCDPICGVCAPDGGKCPPPPPNCNPVQPCGQNFCKQGEYCCNASCGICAPLGGFCTQQLCNPGGTPCGNTTCGKDEYCCNESCSICAPLGGFCTQQICGGGCKQQKDSCANNETCCQGLMCCSGVPIPVGQEYCDAICPISDRNAKTDITRVDDEAVLETVSRLPIYSWRYRTEQPGVQHMGPMAQDFMGAFGLGTTDKAIFTVDADGVALAAVKALHGRLERLEAENARLRERVTELESKSRR